MSFGPDISLSIITPVYNREDCIQRCIESVISQNYDALELLIVDDGSFDHTALIIDEFVRKHSFIRFFQFKENKGVNAARNYAIKKSVNQFIIFLDSDDIFLPNALNTINSFLKKYAGYKHYLFAQDDRMFYIDQHGLLSKPFAELSFSDFLLGKVGGDFLHVMDRNIIQKFLFDESLRIYEGLNFLRIIKEEQHVFYIKEVLVQRERGRRDSVTNEYRLTNKKAILNKYSFIRLQLEIFEEDYIYYDKSGNIIKGLIKEGYLLGVILNKYPELSYFYKYLNRNYGKNVPLYYRLLSGFRCGYILRHLIYVYSGLKSLLRNKRTY